MKKELKKAQARIRALERALEPFAREATEWWEKCPDRYRPGMTEPGSNWAQGRAVFNIGHLRRAHRLVARA